MSSKVIDDLLTKNIDDQYPEASVIAQDRPTAALQWFELGYKVLPTDPVSKEPTVVPAEWLPGLSARKIQAYWEIYPEHDVAIHCADDVVVFDADSPESQAALTRLEMEFGMAPIMGVKTKKGVHHYFRKSEGLLINADSHATDHHPERIDIRCGNGYAIVAPSTNKTIASAQVCGPQNLCPLSQAFVDALFKHNGRSAPTARPIASETREPSQDTDSLSDSENRKKLVHMLSLLDPDEGGRERWVRVLTVIFNETEGSDEGLAIADQWSSRGEKYEGLKDVETRWKSFRLERDAKATIKTLAYLLSSQNIDWVASYADATEPFEATQATEVDGQVVESGSEEAQSLQEPTPKFSLGVDTGVNPMAVFSMRGKLEEYKKKMVEQAPLLEHLGHVGEITIITAAANTGKTLITLKLLTEAIESGRIEDPRKIAYINADDNQRGNAEKIALAEKYGFEIIITGEADNTIANTIEMMEKMTKEDTATGVILIFDTLINFADVMIKSEIAEFLAKCRAFVRKGGTVVALAHNNKVPGANGKPIYAGTADICNAVDNLWVVERVKTGPNQFKAIHRKHKDRATFADRVEFEYQKSKEMSYVDILNSVKFLTEDFGGYDDSEDDAPKVDEDALIVDCLKDLIGSGELGKTELMEQASSQLTGVKKTKISKLLESHTGSDPAIHLWSVVKKRHNKHAYQLLIDELEDLTI
jgi:archaellum biogenesis ATPase FlaH